MADSHSIQGDPDVELERYARSLHAEGQTSEQGGVPVLLVLAAPLIAKAAAAVATHVGERALAWGLNKVFGPSTVVTHVGGPIDIETLAQRVFQAADALRAATATPELANELLPRFARELQLITAATSGLTLANVPVERRKEAILGKLVGTLSLLTDPAVARLTPMMGRERGQASAVASSAGFNALRGLWSVVRGDAPSAASSLQAAGAEAIKALSAIETMPREDLNPSAQRAQRSIGSVLLSYVRPLATSLASGAIKAFLTPKA